MKSLSSVAAACAALLVSLAPLESEAAGTFRLADDSGYGGAESLDPISPTRFYNVIKLVYSRMVRQGEDGQPSPDLALSWSSSSDAKEWTFNLRRGVKFHDGSDFTAHDVAYSLMRIKSEKIKSPVAAVLSIVEGVDPLDDYTAKVRLSTPHADFPLLLMDYRARILSSRAGAGNVDALNETGVGTGPFKVSKLDARGTTILEAFPGYWEGKPDVDRVEVISIPDQQARVQAVLAGQVDYVAAVTQQQQLLFSDKSAYAVQSVQTGDWSGIVMRTDTAPFTDSRVRRALRILVDREAMMKLLVGENGGVVSCDDPVWSGDPYRADLTCPQDLPEAKRLLSDAGFPKGLDVVLYTSDLRELWTKMAEVYQQQAAAAGVHVDIRLVPGDSYWSATWMKKDFVATDWSQRPADQVLNEVYHSGAAWDESSFNDPHFDETLSAARRALEPSQRRALYGEAQKILYAEGGTLIPFHKSTVRVLSARVKGIPNVQEFSIRWNKLSVGE